LAAGSTEVEAMNSRRETWLFGRIVRPSVSPDPTSPRRKCAVDLIAALRISQPLPGTTLDVRSEQSDLKLHPCPPLVQALRTASPTAVGKDGTITRLALKPAEGPLRGEIQAMRLGPIRWVSLPGESFVETGLALKQAGASFMVGYANGYLGYSQWHTGDATATLSCRQSSALKPAWLPGGRGQDRSPGTGGASLLL